MARSMALHSRQRDAYVHDSYRSTYDACCTQERSSVDGSRLRLAATYRRSLDAHAESVDAQKAHCTILVCADESVL